MNNNVQNINFMIMTKNHNFTRITPIGVYSFIRKRKKHIMLKNKIFHIEKESKRGYSKKSGSWNISSELKSFIYFAETY